MSGCGTVNRYPDRWGPLDAGERTEDCPKLAGVYANVGEKPDGTPSFALAHILSDATGHDRTLERPARYQYWKDLSGAKSVQLLVTNEPGLAIKVTGEGILHEWTVPKTQFECRTGAISLFVNESGAWDNAAVLGVGSLDLYRIDDHLVLNRSGGGAGFVLFIPVVLFTSTWSRFPLVKNP